MNDHNCLISHVCPCCLPKHVFQNLLVSYLFSCVPASLLHQIMSVQQLYRICTLYWDANYNTRSVSPDVTFFPFPSLFSLITGKMCDNMLHSPFRSFQAWEYLWLRTLIMLKVILSCWMTVPGEIASIRKAFNVALIA